MAQDLAEQGIAVIGFDQIHHGERNPTGAPEDLAAFNVVNPEAFRDNFRQSVVDLVQQVRLCQRLTLPMSLLGRNAALRTDRIAVFGHSQGGISQSIFVAIDDVTLGGVLSGAGAVLSVALVEKEEPVDVPTLLRSIVRIGPEADPEGDPLRLEHPVLSLVQTFAESADPVNYAASAVPSGHSLLQTEGVADAYTPPSSIEALATAAQIPQVEPVLQP
ncbi:MAG: hypothetical protein AAF550_02830, partial [Myxococcota bacterium]